FYLGDPEHYTRFYNSLFGVHPRNWAALQRAQLGSAEPLYRYVIGAAAFFGIDRIQYISMWNGVLTASIGYVLLKHQSSIIFAVLVFTNYYLMVILGSAERLKFAYIFLTLSACAYSIRPKYILSVI